MDEAEIARTLSRLEDEVAAGSELDSKRFWEVVGAVKRRPDLTEAFADRIGELDRRSFLSWDPMVRIPAAAGNAISVAALSAGLGAVGAAYFLEAPWNGLSVLLGTGVLLGATHGLAHVLVGSAQGMRFTHWFAASPTRPQPGVKVDYATYLRVPARRRAWMHASGALTTKAVPFLMIGAAVAARTPAWTTWALAGLGVLQVVTDAAWSVRSSDWKRFRREMGYAGRR